MQLAAGWRGVHGVTPWVYDSLLAVYCSVQVVASESASEKGSSLLDGLYVLLRLVDRALVPVLSLRYALFTNHRTHIFWGSIFLFASLILVVLRVLARFRRIETALLTLGVIVVVAAPLSWRRIIYVAPFRPSVPLGWWQWLEVAAVATSVLYSTRRRTSMGCAT